LNVQWDQRYIDKDIPWDSGYPDHHLQGYILHANIQPTTSLIIGCGTGTNAIWLAKQGHQVLALDLSATALSQAQSKVVDENLSVTFLKANVIEDPIPVGPYGFAYDRGCFHVFGETTVRKAFASKVASTLGPDGIWLSVIGSTDGPPRNSGPPRRSITEITAAVEPCFEILRFESQSFDPEFFPEARGWVMLARKRRHYLSS